MAAMIVLVGEQSGEAMAITLVMIVPVVRVELQGAARANAAVAMGDIIL